MRMIAVDHQKGEDRVKYWKGTEKSVMMAAVALG
jgi:hypothetical protein